MASRASLTDPASPENPYLCPIISPPMSPAKDKKFEKGQTHQDEKLGATYSH